jgi:NCS1 family nucleobase:cation symporter-1
MVVYHVQLTDPILITTKFSSTAVVIIGLVMVILATMSTNVAANVVSPSYDFSNTAPRLISFRVGGLITGVLGVLIQPWHLISNPHIYIYVWLGFYGGILGTIAGVLIAGYWVLSRTQLALADLYTTGGRYWFTAGWNWRAVVATLAGAVLAVGGAWSAPGAGPFPLNGVIPALKPLYSYSWAVGLGTGFVVYLLLSVLTDRRRLTRYTTTDRCGTICAWMEIRTGGPASGPISPALLASITTCSAVRTITRPTERWPSR